MSNGSLLIVINAHKTRPAVMKIKIKINKLPKNKLDHLIYTLWYVGGFTAVDL